MKTQSLLTILLTLTFLSSFSQKPSMELTFTANNNNVYLQTESIKVINKSKDCDTTLFWPDTVLILDYQVGLSETAITNFNMFTVFQNYPNPVIDRTKIKICTPENDIISLTVTDLSGRQLLSSTFKLIKGVHEFIFVPGKQNQYILTANWKNQKRSIKINNVAANLNRSISLKYVGLFSSTLSFKSDKAIQNFNFSLGDTLLYIGNSDILQSGIIDTPANSKIYTFQFAYNIPCIGTPSVMYGGQTYNTVQIFSQCWLKENLNIGTLINGDQQMEDNSIIEKYCYNNEPDSCIKYGGLYQWDEMMQYMVSQGVQGICPPGWHIPSDEEWKVLEGATDSQYDIGDPIWDEWENRGYNAGINLKSNTGWYNGGNGTDTYGFSGLPGGNRNGDGSFVDIGVNTDWWSSTELWSDGAWTRGINMTLLNVDREYCPREEGQIVRCLKD